MRINRNRALAGLALAAGLLSVEVAPSGGSVAAPPKLMVPWVERQQLVEELNATEGLLDPAFTLAALPSGDDDVASGRRLAN